MLHLVVWLNYTLLRMCITLLREQEIHLAKKQIQSLGTLVVDY